MTKNTKNKKTTTAGGTEPEKNAGIRFSVFYEQTSKRGTSHIYKEGIPLTAEQSAALGINHASHPKPITQSLYLNIDALKERYDINGAINGFDVVLIPRL